jgi:hypothetical protein
MAKRRVIKERQTAQWPKEERTTGQPTIYKTLHIKLKIE